MILTDLFESQEIHNQDRLDQVLARCIEMVHKNNAKDPEKYGKVAACIIDMKNRKVFGINLPGPDGTRRHAERVAIDKYHKTYGKILPGAIIVTTLSPCNRPMEERDGPSCQDLLMQAGIEKVYSGYMDPSQHSDHPFTEEVTKNDDLWEACKQLSDSFVHDDLTESWGPEHYPGVLPVGDYLSPDSEFVDPTGKKDPLYLHQEVDDLINAGIKPRLRLFKPSQLLATQDWLSNDPGDGPLYPEYAKLPVIYQKNGNYYILDGHHRVTQALKSNRDIECYLFKDTQYNELDEGVKSRLAQAALAGGLALGAGGANAMDWKDAAMTGAMFVPGIGQAVKAYNVGKSLYQAGTAAKQYRDLDKELTALAAKNKAENPRGPTTVTYDPDNADKLDPVDENFADGKVKGKSRPGRVKRAGASCDGSVSDLRAKARKYGGERGKMYHWCANMKGGKKK